MREGSDSQPKAELALMMNHGTNDTEGYERGI